MFSECVMPCSVEIAMRVMALLFKSVWLGVGKPIIVAAAVIMQRSLELFLTDNMLKKQVEQNGKVGFCHAPKLHRLIDKTFGGLTSSCRLFVEKILNICFEGNKRRYLSVG